MPWTRSTLRFAAVGALLIGGLLFWRIARTALAGPARAFVRVDPRLAKAETGMGLRLFRQLAGPEGQNVFVSPFSIQMALAMTYNGAAGQTEKAMAKTLGLEGLSLDEVNRGHARLLRSLRASGPKTRLEIANSLWADKGVRLRPEFAKANEASYGAHLETVLFSDPRTAGRINGWVADQTHGRIEGLFQPGDLSPPTFLALVNAVYFRGAWATPFGRRQTKPAPFALPGGGRRELPMMTRTGEFRYLEESGLRGVSLPYADGLGMVLLLPDLGVRPAEFARRMTPEAWERWMLRFDERKGTLFLPRFRLTYEQELKEALAALGMGVAFSGSADFSRMCAVPGPISVVRHKAFVEVTEEGTEAAAATGLARKNARSRAPEPFVLRLDRPFYCAIRDEWTGTLLFLGYVADPQPAG